MIHSFSAKLMAVCENRPIKVNFQKNPFFILHGVFSFYPLTILSSSLLHGFADHLVLPVRNKIIFNINIIHISQNLEYRNGVLHSGTLDALIDLLIPTIDYYPDKKYLFAFLLTSRLFIPPHELLGKIISICDSQQNFANRSSQNKVIIFEYDILE